MTRDLMVTFSVDGLCTLDIAYTGPGTYDRSSAGDLKKAAFTLIRECVGQQRMGGDVTGLGE